MRLRVLNESMNVFTLSSVVVDLHALFPGSRKTSHAFLLTGVEHNMHNEITKEQRMHKVNIAVFMSYLDSAEVHTYNRRC